jgi:hypothetical protein
MNADPLGATIIGLFKHSLTVMAARPLSWALYNRDLRVVGDFFRRNDLAQFRNRYMLDKEFMRTMQKLGLVREGIDIEAASYFLYVINQGFLSIDPAQLSEPPPALDRMLAFIGEILGPYLTPEGLTDTQAGKDLLNGLFSAYRDAMEGDTPTPGT